MEKLERYLNGYVTSHRPDAHHQPGFMYTSPEVYNLEKESIFMKHWICLGREEEIPHPGDYLTFRVADEPVVICRNREGRINAFSNVCAHRGTEVAAGCGNAKAFHCPYHGWVYDLTGKLLAAKYMEDANGFDLQNCRLPPVKVDLWDGFLFVNFDPDSESLINFLGDSTEVYGPYKCENLRLAAKFTIELDCNWKLMAENLVDIYHIAVLHAATFGPHQPLDTYRFQLTEGGYHGRFKGGTLTPDGKSLFGPMPWLPEELCSGGYSSHIRPNMAFFPRFDYLSFITSWPMEGPDRSQGIVYLLFPETYLEEAEFKNKLKVYEDFFRTLLAEDVSMVTSLQKGLRSRAYSPGPFSRFEAAVHNVMDYTTRRIAAGVQSKINLNGHS
jgi:choline monooxygenase